MAIETEVLRLRILKALVAVLEETGRDEPRFDIRDENDQPLADMTGRVYRGRSIFGDGDDIPMLSILEVPIPLDQVPPPSDSPYSNGTWELLIQGFTKDDPENPTDPAHKLMAAVKKRLAEAKMVGKGYRYLGFNKAVIDLRIGAGVVRPPDEVSAKAYFWLNVSLDITESLDDPFEQG